MTIQSNNNLNYLTDPTLTTFNRLFVLSFERNAKGGLRDSFSHYYIPIVEIKNFIVLIDGRSFFELQVKMKRKLTRKSLRSVEIMTTRLVIYWILLILKKITD